MAPASHMCFFQVPTTVDRDHRNFPIIMTSMLYQHNYSPTNKNAGNLNRAKKKKEEIHRFSFWILNEKMNGPHNCVGKACDLEAFFGSADKWSACKYEVQVWKKGCDTRDFSHFFRMWCLMNYMCYHFHPISRNSIKIKNMRNCIKIMTIVWNAQ